MIIGHWRRRRRHDCRCDPGRLSAARVNGTVHDALAGVTGTDSQGIGNLQAQRRFITLIGVGAVAVTAIGRRRGLGAGKQIVARGILAVKQAQHLVFKRTDLAGNRLAVGIAARTARFNGQGTGRLQCLVDCTQYAFLVGQRVLQTGDIAVELPEHVLLLLQQQQPRRRHRVIRCGLHAHTGTGLLLGLHHAGIVVRVLGGTGFKILCSGNTHRPRLP